MMDKRRTIRVSNFEYALRKLMAYTVYYAFILLMCAVVTGLFLFIHGIPELLVNALF